MASTVGTRLAYEKAKQALANAGFNPNQVVLSQSYLRLEVALSTSITNYQFPVAILLALTQNAAWHYRTRSLVAHFSWDSVYVVAAQLLTFSW